MSSLTAVLIVTDKVVASCLTAELRETELSVVSYPDFKSFSSQARPARGTLYFIDSTPADIPIEDLIRSIRASDAAAVVYVLLDKKNSKRGRALLECGADDCFGRRDSIQFVVLKALNQCKKMIHVSAESINQGVKLLAEGNLLLKHGTKLKLTPSEFKIIQALIGKQDEVVTRSEIIHALEGDGITQRVVDVHVSSLRKKLFKLGIGIETQWGKGYRINLKADARSAQVPS